MTPSRFEATPFQSTRKLPHCNFFQNVLVPHIDVVNSLMQRCAVEVSLEYFNLR